jgi:hypothetical protein
VHVHVLQVANPRAAAPTHGQHLHRTALSTLHCAPCTLHCSIGWLIPQPPRRRANSTCTARDSPPCTVYVHGAQCRVLSAVRCTCTCFKWLIAQPAAQTHGQHLHRTALCTLHRAPCTLHCSIGWLIPNRADARTAPAPHGTLHPALCTVHVALFYWMANPPTAAQTHGQHLHRTALCTLHCAPCTLHCSIGSR